MAPAFGFSAKDVDTLLRGGMLPEEIEEYLGKSDTICESVVVGRKAPDSDAIILTAVVFPAYDKFPTGASEELIREKIEHFKKMGCTLF